MYLYTLTIIALQRKPVTSPKNKKLIIFKQIKNHSYNDYNATTLTMIPSYIHFNNIFN